MTRYGPAAVAAALGLALAACGTLFDSAKVDYKSEKKLPPLEVPPDLTTPAREERYQIPEGSPTGPTTLSAYNAERSGAPRPGSTAILPEIEKVRIDRSGSERWLVVPEPPEKVWPIVKDFWQGLGFVIKTEVPEAGVMETDWAENRAKIKDDPIRNMIGAIFDAAYSTSERDKYRTRLERGAQANTTEIYITHRGVAEIYVSESRDRTVWQPRPPDPSLEAEFLRRLMVRFGVDDARARAQVAVSAVSKDDGRAKIVAAENGIGRLELAEPFDRAWRRVGLVLDRVGFTVEDRDRSKGFYFVRYVDPEADALDTKNESFLGKLAFWRSAPDPKAEQYRVFVKDRNDSSEVQVLNKEGNPASSDTARKILSLLQQQLK
jgi:outer membrane protein assembly factor BamC